MLPQHTKKYKVTIEFEISGDIADLVTEEHIAGNISDDLNNEGVSFEEATDEIELWGEYYGEHEDVWYLYRHSQDSKVSVEEVEDEITEEEMLDGMDKLVNGPFGSGPKNINTSFTIYHDGGDTEIIESPVLTEKNEFVFMGFSDSIHPYFVKQMKWIDVMLESKGIYLNRKTYRHVDEIGEAPNGWWDDPEKINLPPTSEMNVSSDGFVYFHAQDSEMGRGGAVLMRMTPNMKEKEILMSDHRDNVRDDLYTSFVVEMGVDVTRVQVKDINKINYE